MINKHLIIASSFTLLFCAPARAQVPCEMLDGLMYSVSLVTQLDPELNDKQYGRLISKLDVQISKVSLAALIPMKASGDFPLESKSLLQYTSSLREAVAGAKAGYNDYAKEIIGRSTGPNITRSLTSLESYWNCSDVQSSDNSSIDISDNEALYFGSGSSTTNQAAQTIEGPGREPSEQRGSLSASQILSQVAFKPVEINTGSTLISVILIICSSIAGVTFLKARSKKAEVREARRQLYLPVMVRIGAMSHNMLLVDLSMNGIKIKHPGVIDGDIKLRINLEGKWREGNIRWSNKFFAGVMFKTPLDANTFNRLVEASAV